MGASVSIRLVDSLVHQPEDIAEKTERSKAFHIQKAIEVYIEEYADLLITFDRLHNQTDPIISSKEMRSSLGIPNENWFTKILDRL